MKKSGCLKIFFLFFLANCLSHGIIWAQSFPYKFNYLTVDNGLSHTDANDIVQDNRGFIWVATFYGLDRYDGFAVKKYYNRNVPLNNAFRNRLVCLYPDESGDIWLSTEEGLQRFDTRTEKYIDYKDPKDPGNPGFWKIIQLPGNGVYGLSGSRLRKYTIRQHELEKQNLNLPPGIRFSDMVAGHDGTIYLSGNKGVWKLDKEGSFTNIPVKGLLSNEVSGLYFDKTNHLLLLARNILYQVSLGSGGIDSPANQPLLAGKQYTFDNHTVVKSIIQGTNSGYWLNAGTVLYRLDSNLNFIQTITRKNDEHSLNSRSITRILVDRSQCLWVCTFGGGVNYCDLNEKPFYTLQHIPEDPNSLSGNHIRSILEDGEDLWIGTQANGLNRYNIKTQKFAGYYSTNSPVKLISDAVTSLTMDEDHNLWIGTASGIVILQPDRKKLWRPPGYDSFPAYGIETLARDCYGNIWFGNHIDKCGVIWKDKQNIFHVKYYGEGYFILADKKRPELFISSTQGLKHVIIDDQGNITRTFSYQASGKPNSLSSNYTYPVSRQDDSTYWIGTIGGGLNRLALNTKDSSSTLRSFTGLAGILDDVEGLEIDNDGKIWIGGTGLECFEPLTGKLIKYDKNDGLQGNSFKVGASYKGADGRLYFGGINGLNYFYPGQVKPNGIAARPMLTDILINDMAPHYENVNSPENAISGTIGSGKELRLNYRQNNFAIFFSSMHFANQLKCQYRYQLTGIDKDWKYTDGKNPVAAYSNLDYGRHTFIVEATNNDGIWSKDRAETIIILTPPWWRSTPAKIIYALLILSALSGIYIYQARWYRLKRELDLHAFNEKRQEEIHQQREQLYQQQLTFFTNISHEFRTPLSLILGPLENLIGQNKNSALDNLYQLMFRNAKRLVNLIGELMNFKKVSDSIIKLRVQPLAVNEFCKGLTREFQVLADSKGIIFEMTDRTHDQNTAVSLELFDVQVLERILLNLLDNAFKYTNTGGKIEFDVFFDRSGFKPAFVNGFQLLNEVHRAKNYIYFRIADTGIGISAESLASIFNRYYRVGTHHLGSGIGLALVKSLTQLHKGDIYVYSQRNEGTEIIIGIPRGEENYDPSEFAATGTNPEAWLEPLDKSLLFTLPDPVEEDRQAASRTKKHILLVDDNAELRRFLKQSLEKKYYVYEAEDGDLALEMAIAKGPDLIISDVMMPRMSGIELCRLIKEKFETRHIPFIILSAKDALDTKIEGMESGADYYFSKPLSIDLLLLTVHNIFDQAEYLKQRYLKDYLSEASELVHSEKDKAFLHDLGQLIGDNIHDPDLDVDFLCDRLLISRTKLYQKIQSISDQSVAEFIRTIRLKKAIQIMTNENLPMNEVAYRIGMQSSSNFSRAFKKEYGMSPMQFMQSLKKD
ncbi:hybrid sensor histidine kinase/response regulator transcription factor [Flavitalea flava]